VVFVWRGANGKSTFLQLILSLLGDYAIKRIRVADGEKERISPDRKG